MTNDVLWLVRLGLDQGLFSRKHATAVRSEVGNDADIGTFAQRLVDAGYVEDVDTLEKIAGLAMNKGQKGPPSGDPFDDSGTEPPFAHTAAAAKVEAETKKSSAGPADRKSVV